MIVIYTAVRAFSQSLKAKLQKRTCDGRFAKPIPTVKAVEKNPLVRFYYPSSKTGLNTWRTVRLISATSKYVVGLEITQGKDKPHYQYKKFSREKAGNFSLLEFSPDSMS
jgi:hypothetical protein